MNNNTQKELNSFAYDLVIEYSKYDNNYYTIDINNIPDIELDKLCSLIIRNTPEFGNEILGPDNDYYEDNILPSLINHLKNSDSKILKQEFLDKLSIGTRRYLHHNMIKLLDDQLENFIYDNKINAA